MANFGEILSNIALGAGQSVRRNAGDSAFEAFTPGAGGSGDVVGPASAVDSRVVMFDGTTGKLIKDSGVTLSGSNTGDQTSIVGITGTKAQFDTAVTDGNILYVGDVTQYTDEMAQDAIGAMVDTTLVYTDATPLLSRAALTGDVTASAGSNALTIANGAVTAAKTSITGTPNGTKYLRDDFSWQAVSGSSDYSLWAIRGGFY